MVISAYEQEFWMYKYWLNKVLVGFIGIKCFDQMLWFVFIGF